MPTRMLKGKVTPSTARPATAPDWPAAPPGASPPAPRCRRRWRPAVASSVAPPDRQPEQHRASPGRARPNRSGIRIPKPSRNSPLRRSSPSLAADDQSHLQQEQGQRALEQVVVQALDRRQALRPCDPADRHAAEQQRDALAEEGLVQHHAPVGSRGRRRAPAGCRPRSPAPPSPRGTRSTAARRESRARSASSRRPQRWPR
jgi:hypothetical protein